MGDIGPEHNSPIPSETRPFQAMPEEQLKAFLEAVKADAGLQEKLKTAKDADAVVEIAKAAGYAISVDELKKSQAEISEEELEGVAGGGTAIKSLCWNPFLGEC
ncbi:MAG: Nif11-like leader peptide family natural product precursor [Synechococcus sp.]